MDMTVILLDLFEGGLGVRSLPKKDVERLARRMPKETSQKDNKGD